MMNKFDNVFSMVDALKINIKNTSNHNKSHHSSVYYRGQTNPWPIISSLHRIGDKAQSEWKKTLYFCQWLEDNNYTVFESDIQWGVNTYIAVAQHYGYKTDFIDFTSNIEVAAFFASDYEQSGDVVNEKYGVLWCIDQDELEDMSEYLKGIISKGIISENTIIDTFERNNFNPFFEFNLEGLSRVNNQSGVFLWDYNGIFSKYIGYPDYYFLHQKGKKYTSELINKNFIYPHPNALEREIERYLYSRTVRETTSSDVFAKLSKKFTTTYMKSPNEIYSEFDEVLSIIDWDDKNWESINKQFYPNLSTYKVTEMQISEKNILENGVSKSSCENYTAIYRKNMQSNVITHFELDGKESLIADAFNDIISTLLLYPYSNIQIADSLYYTILFLNTVIHRVSERLKIIIGNVSWGSLSEKDLSIDIEAISRFVYNEDTCKLGFEDITGVSSYGYVPISLLNNVSKAYKKAQLENLKTYYKVEFDNLKGMPWHAIMKYNTNPRKLFDLEDICTIFTKCILPYQFLFRPKSGRIYIPTFLTNIGFA